MTEHQHLNRETILRTAIEIADQGGIDKVSMRAIASRFEVTAMSLYRHVAGKDAILDGMIDQVVAEVALAELPDWKETVRTAAISTRDVLVRHPWAPAMWLSRQSEGPARLRWGDFLLRALGNGALSEEGSSTPITSWRARSSVPRCNSSASRMREKSWQGWPATSSSISPGTTIPIW
jgi:AcrR family transcriptional regulator